MKIALIYNDFIPCGVGFYFLKAFQKTPHDITHFNLKDASQISHDFDLYIRVDEGDYSAADLPVHLRPRVSF